MLNTPKKKLGWTLKFDGDAVKLPEFKLGAFDDMKPTVDGTVDLPAAGPCGVPPSVTTIALDNDVPAGHEVVLVALKIEGTPPKEKLEVSTQGPPDAGKPAAVVHAGWLPDANGNNPFLFFGTLPNLTPPQPPNTIVVTNPNPAAVKLSVQVAYRKK